MKVTGSKKPSLGGVAGASCPPASDPSVGRKFGAKRLNGSMSPGSAVRTVGWFMNATDAGLNCAPARTVPLPKLRLKPDGRDWRLEVEDEWLRAHSLVDVALEQEREEWKSVGVDIKVLAT